MSGLRGTRKCAYAHARAGLLSFTVNNYSEKHVVHSHFTSCHERATRVRASSTLRLRVLAEMSPRDSSLATQHVDKVMIARVLTGITYDEPAEARALIRREGITGLFGRVTMSSARAHRH